MYAVREISLHRVLSDLRNAGGTFYAVYELYPSAHGPTESLLTAILSNKEEAMEYCEMNFPHMSAEVRPFTTD